MEKYCEIVRDLLPLYLDGVCSETSKKLVAKHLGECPACASEYRSLQAPAFEGTLREEQNRAILHRTVRERRKSVFVGMILAAIFLVPVLVCFIVNLAAGQALDWFFIVVSSLLVCASLTVLPLTVPKNRFLLTLGGFAVSLCLLLAVCCLYTGGGWFFVAASASLFGLCVVFLPFAVRCEPFRRILGKHKALTVFTADTVLFCLMLTAIGFFVGSEQYWNLAFAISLPLVAAAWGILFLFRVLPVSRIGKVGILVLFLALVNFLINPVVGFFLSSPVPLPRFTPTVWNVNTTADNVDWLILIGAFVLAVIFAAVGAIRRKKGAK